MSTSRSYNPAYYSPPCLRCQRLPEECRCIEVLLNDQELAQTGIVVQRLDGDISIRLRMDDPSMGDDSYRLCASIDVGLFTTKHEIRSAERAVSTWQRALAHRMPAPVSLKERLLDDLRRRHEQDRKSNAALALEINTCVEALLLSRLTDKHLERGSCRNAESLIIQGLTRHRSGAVQCQLIFEALGLKNASEIVKTATERVLAYECPFDAGREPVTRDRVRESLRSWKKTTRS